MDAPENVTLSGSGLRHRRGAGGGIFTSSGRAEWDETVEEEPSRVGTDGREGLEQGEDKGEDCEDRRSEGPDLDGEGQGSEARGRQAEAAEGIETESRAEEKTKEEEEEHLVGEKAQGEDCDPVLLSYEEYRAEVVRRRLAHRKRRARMMMRPRGAQSSRGRLLYFAFLAFAVAAFMYIRSGGPSSSLKGRKARMGGQHPEARHQATHPPSQRGDEAVLLADQRLPRACESSLTRYHEALTGWFSGSSALKGVEELWDAMDMGKRMTLTPPGGAEMNADAVRELLKGAKGAYGPGFRTEPHEASCRAEPEGLPVSCRFVEHQQSSPGGRVRKVYSTALCGWRSKERDRVQWLQVVEKDAPQPTAHGPSWS